MTDQSWHAQPAAAVVARVGSAPSGLTDEEAARRLERHGPNRLAPAPPVSAARILASQFRSVVVLLLVAAALVSAVLADTLQTIAILVVIALNAGLGFTIELRARRAMESLLHLGSSTAAVVRGGILRTVDADLLVPGDIVELSAGQRVPADGRLLEGAELRMNEAALTGESLPVGKEPAAVLEADLPLADRVTMAYRGTAVAGGTGRMVVTGTAAATEVGRIGALTEALPQERTPLERKLDALGHRLVWVALGTAAIVAVLGAVQGAPWGLMIETAIALAVAAVPEGLPAVATIALAIGLRRMARRRALVRRLAAVEALGSTTVICTDKTRTLTAGVMTVVRAWVDEAECELDGSGANAPPASIGELLEVASAASRDQPEAAADEVTGDPVDRAVRDAAARAGRGAPSDWSAPVAVVPFSSERKLMATFHRSGERLRVAVKGAPLQLLERSRRLRTPGGDVALEDGMRRRVLDANARLAAAGLRVLAVATGEAGDAGPAALEGLTFLGLVGLMDPPAAGVKEAVAQLRRAGLRTIMLTGDQRITAEAVGRLLGVVSPGDDAIEGRELGRLDAGELDARLARTSVFSRIAPEDKLTIVGALQRQGQIVAMLGDGVNDAPALRKADVGVAMGRRGTDVARESADVVLEDDRFETIVAAVEEGRVIFDNIGKFVFYLFSCNLAEILVLLAAGLLQLPVPMTPLQILWLNLATDTFPALALAVEPGDADVMARPPRDPGREILSWTFLLEVLFYAALITAVTLGVFLWALAQDRAHAAELAFMTLVGAQVFHLGTARRREGAVSWTAATSNPYAIGAVALVAGLQLLALYVPPLPRVLALSPLTGAEWGLVIGASLVPAIAGQLIRRRA